MKCFLLLFIKYYFSILFAIFFLFVNPNLFYANGILYSIQIDEFNDPESAENRVNSLSQLGHNAFFQCETSENGEKVCRVFIEKFETKREAEEEADFLKKLELISTYSIREIREKTQASLPDVMGSTKSYSIHVGSYQEKGNVEKMIEHLSQKGYKAFYKYETVQGRGNYFRVYVNGYRSKKEAEIEAERLKRSGIISFYSIKTIDKVDQIAPDDQKTKRELYVLLVNSYKKSSEAEKSIRILKENGFAAFYIAEESSEGTWFRIYIGQFDDKKKALQTGAELKEKGFIPSFQTLVIN